MRKRAVGVIIKNNKILLIHRIKKDMDVFVFPGGGVESGETLEQAENQFIPKWKSFKEIKALNNLLPKEIKSLILESLKLALYF